MARACAIVVEGRDDAAAVRALIREEFLVEPKRGSVAGGPIEFEPPGVKAALYDAHGKAKLAELAILAAQGRADTRPDRVVVFFDPDRDPTKREFQFFEKAFEREVSKRKAGPLSHEDGKLVFSCQALRGSQWVIFGLPTQRGQEGSDDLEPEVLLVAVAVGRPGKV